jgi:hypothetical protein
MSDWNNVESQIMKLEDRELGIGIPLCNFSTWLRQKIGSLRPAWAA